MPIDWNASLTFRYQANGERCRSFKTCLAILSSPLVSIRFVDEERGRGLVANRRIHPGQLILEEAPVMLLGSDMQQDHQREIIYQYNRLTKQQKKIYNSLSYNKLLKGSGNLVKILNIWYTNNVSTKNSKFDEDDVKGMYFRFSMSVNHSCIPNCVLNFDEERNSLPLPGLPKEKNLSSTIWIQVKVKRIC